MYHQSGTNLYRVSGTGGDRPVQVMRRRPFVSLAPPAPTAVPGGTVGLTGLSKTASTRPSRFV